MHNKKIISSLLFFHFLVCCIIKKGILITDLEVVARHLGVHNLDFIRHGAGHPGRDQGEESEPKPVKDSDPDLVLKDVDAADPVFEESEPEPVAEPVFEDSEPENHGRDQGDAGDPEPVADHADVDPFAEPVADHADVDPVAEPVADHADVDLEESDEENDDEPNGKYIN